MPVKVIRPVGRPSFIEVELLNWGKYVATKMEQEQRAQDFIATGDSLDTYEVEVVKRNQVEIRMADYLKYSIEGRGRKPGGKMAPLSAILDWIEVKGIQPQEGTSLNSLAFLIARKQRDEGNLVHRNERLGIPIDMILAESWDQFSDQLAYGVALGAAEAMVKIIESTTATS